MPARGRADTAPAPRPAPALGLAAARGWLRATARTAVAAPNLVVAPVRYPAWFEIATLLALSQPSRSTRIDAAETGRDAMPLATLFAVPLPDGWSVHEAARGSSGTSPNTVTRTASARDRSTPDASTRITPRFGAQALSVLSYLHERDPSVIPALANGLAQGRPIEDVLRSSTVLPHDLAGLDADWRQWARHRPKTTRSQVPRRQ